MGRSTTRRSMRSPLWKGKSASQITSVIRPGGFEASLREAERRSNLVNLLSSHRDCFAKFILSVLRLRRFAPQFILSVVEGLRMSGSEGLAVTPTRFQTDKVLATLGGR